MKHCFCTRVSLKNSSETQNIINIGSGSMGMSIEKELFNIFCLLLL